MALCDACEAEKRQPAETEPSRRRRRIPRPDFYDLRQLVMLLAWLAGFSGLIMGDIWLSGHI